MTTAKSKRRSPRTPVPARDRPNHLAHSVRRVTGALKIVGASTKTLILRVPWTVRATRAGAQGTTSALQTLPDPTLRWLAASSVGLGAGFYLTGAPRLVIAAGVAPALMMGAAIALRRTEPILPAKAER